MKDSWTSGKTLILAFLRWRMQRKDWFPSGNLSKSYVRLSTSVDSRRHKNVTKSYTRFWTEDFGKRVELSWFSPFFLHSLAVVTKRGVDDGNQNGGCSLQPAQGSHGYYRINEPSFRKCYFLLNLTSLHAMIYHFRRWDEAKSFNITSENEFFLAIE